MDEFGQTSNIRTYRARITIEPGTIEGSDLILPTINVTPEEYSKEKRVIINYDAKYDKIFKILSSEKVTSLTDLIACTTTSSGEVCSASNIVSAGTNLKSGVWYKASQTPELKVVDVNTTIIAKVKNEKNYEKLVSIKITKIDTNPTKPEITGGVHLLVVLLIMNIVYQVIRILQAVHGIRWKIKH